MAPRLQLGTLRQQVYAWKAGEGTRGEEGLGAGKPGMSSRGTKNQSLSPDFPGADHFLALPGGPRVQEKTKRLQGIASALKPRQQQDSKGKCRPALLASMDAKNPKENPSRSDLALY